VNLELEWWGPLVLTKTARLSRLSLPRRRWLSVSWWRTATRRTGFVQRRPGGTSPVRTATGRAGRSARPRTDHGRTVECRQM